MKNTVTTPEQGIEHLNELHKAFRPKSDIQQDKSCLINRACKFSIIAK